MLLNWIVFQKTEKNSGEDDIVEDREIDPGLGTSKNNEIEKDQSEFNRSGNGCILDDDDDNFLKITRKNVFNIFPNKVSFTSF